MKLETITQKQDEGLPLLRVLLGATRGVNGNDMLEDVLPKPINLEEMCGRLSMEENFKKKMVYNSYFFQKANYLISIPLHGGLHPLKVATAELLIKLTT